ncbi:mycofactocin-coupled SDR family oxidoreductase [Listeria monocytogenes]|jgi:SDR family mycofactocin-dependent oxidoreductase|uniref:mycofactocin-coupled SDR family oxidoreductase n=1 Tax=Listeria monocytogenes TaxID=1639 RepID=UPI00295526DD|nr:mycofactocin-coupled SDR family oxidoreductase [Listeria monocytogenes]MDV7237591.1 mycofactocin-coupled SDR family oxidoreductase [Listeria monocytogenes]
MGQMDGRVALITGAARGQGRAHALRMAEEGADIIAIDICSDIPRVRYPMGTAEELAETAREVEKLGRRCVSFEADARDAAKLREVVAQGVQELGRLDTVVINHGINLPHSVEDDDAIEVWDTVIGVNFSSQWYTVAATVPFLRDEGGSITIIGSAASLISVYGNAAYTSAKHGLIGLVKSMAMDLSKYGIRVNAVCPGTVPTQLTLNEHTLSVFLPGQPDATYDDMKPALTALNLLPVPWVEVEAITDAVLFLSAKTGKSITGIALPVDAGFTVQQPGMTPVLGQQFYELRQQIEAELAGKI